MIHKCGNNAYSVNALQKRWFTKAEKPILWTVFVLNNRSTHCLSIFCLEMEWLYLQDGAMCQVHIQFQWMWTARTHCVHEVLSRVTRCRYVQSIFFVLNTMSLSGHDKKGFSRTRDTTIHRTRDTTISQNVIMQKSCSMKRRQLLALQVFHHSHHGRHCSRRRDHQNGRCSRS